MEGDKQSRLLTEALQTVTDGSLIERVVIAAASMLEMDGVTAALATDAGGGGVAAASSTRAQSLVDLEFELGEGPGRTAFADDVEVLVADLTTDGVARWPAFSTDAQRHGVAAAFAFPARIGAMRIGMLVAHRDQDGPMVDAQLLDARVFTDICSTLMVDHEAGLDDEAVLVMGWPDRAVVHQATGMVATQLDISLPSALSRLRAYAFGEGRRLDDVARDVVERRLRLPR